MKISLKAILAVVVIGFVLFAFLSPGLFSKPESSAISLEGVKKTIDGYMPKSSSPDPTKYRGVDEKAVEAARLERVRKIRKKDASASKRSSGNGSAYGSPVNAGDAKKRLNKSLGR